MPNFDSRALNRKSERIIIKTGFLTVEGSLQLAAGNLQFGAFYKVVCPSIF